MLNVDEFIQEDIHTSVRVTLCINGFGNGIYSEGGDFTISKFNVMDPIV